MTNICMIAKDRHRLTRQALRSLRENTPADLYNLTVIDDASDEQFWRRDIQAILPEDSINGENQLCVRLSRSKGIVGFVRNLSIRISEQYWGRGDFLLCLDNDLFMKPGWLEVMITQLQRFEEQGLRVLGGVRHPYHGVNRRLTGAGPADQYCVEVTDAVAGYSHMMRWSTWDEFGPYDSHAVGVCQSEDYAYCRKIVDAGFLVGYVNHTMAVDGSALINCGLTNSLGKPAVGSETFPRIPGIIME